MLGDWSYAGLPPSEFWSSSPREFAAVMAGFVQRRIDDHDGRARQGHLTAVLGRVEKIPPVTDFLLGEGGKVRSDQVPAGEGLAAWAQVLGALG